MTTLTTKDPNNYRVVRKICHSCGEQSLVKKERKLASHGFNPYNHDRAEKKDTPATTTAENAKLFTKVVPKTKSMAKAPHFRKKNDGGNAAKTTEREKHSKPSDEKKVKHVDEKHLKSTERLNHAKTADVRGSTRLEASPPAQDDGNKPEKKDEMKQRQKSHLEHHKKDEKHEKKSGLQRQKSHSGNPHDRKDDLCKQKSQSTGKEKKDETLRRQKSHVDKKTDGLQRQKSQSETHKKQSVQLDEKRDSEHKDRGSGHKNEIERQKSQEFRSSRSGEGEPQQSERAEKNRSRSEDNGVETKLKRKNSARHSHHKVLANSGEGATSVMNESMPGKSCTSKGSGEKKHAKVDITRKNTKSLEKSQILAAKTSQCQNSTEKKNNVDKQRGKRVLVNRRVTQPTIKTRPRSLSPEGRPTRKTTISNNITKDEEDHWKSKKERSKSAGLPQQRQRVASEFHYVHQHPVPRVPKSSLSTYREKFYDDVMAQSCLKSLMDKNLKI